MGLHGADLIEALFSQRLEMPIGSAFGLAIGTLNTFSSLQPGDNQLHSQVLLAAARAGNGLVCGGTAY
jgi:hypothetical protein